MAFFHAGWTEAFSPGSRTPFPSENVPAAVSTARAVGTKMAGPGVRVRVGVAVGGAIVGDGVGVAVKAPVAVRDGVGVGVGDGVRVGVGVMPGVGVIVGVELGVSDGVADGVSVFVGVFVGPAATAYEKGSAQSDVWQAVQVAHVPLFAKISIGTPAVFHALTT